MAAIPSVAPTTDLELAEQHRYGDPEAFEEIYRRFASMVYNLAYRLSGKGDVAEDLAQEVFIRIYRHLGRFNGRSTLKTWIYRITLNHCRSRLGRRRLPLQPLSEPDGGEQLQIADTRRGPEDHVLAHDAARRIGAGLQQLRPVFREAVVLRDLEGLSYEEIAVILGVRIGTVRSRIARGRDKLRTLLMEAAS